MLDVRRLAEIGQYRRFSAGQTVSFILGGGVTTRVMYLLVSGRISVYRKDPSGALLPEGTVSPGGAFGGHEFFCGAGEFAYIAAEASVAYIVSEYTFYRLAKTQPEALFEVIKAAYTPLDAFVETREESAPDTVPADTAESAPGAPAAQIIAGGLFPEGHKGYPGITNPQYEKMTYKKDHTCTFCKKTFSGRRVSQSKLYQSSPVRFDIRKYYRDFQAEWYDFIVCPHCCFTAYHTYYKESKPFTRAKIENELEAARSAVRLNFDSERDLDFVFASHYLALVCAPGYTASRRQLTAKIWGNLSWLYEDAGDEEMMRMAALKAAGAYEEVYMESYLTPVQEQITCLSVAGMLYRAGESGDLRKYLYKAKTQSAGNKMYAKLADDLMEMLREEKPEADPDKPK